MEDTGDTDGREAHGHPRLTPRHFPFAIGIVERDEWLWCMTHALDAQPMPSALRDYLTPRMVALSDHMRNQPEL